MKNEDWEKIRIMVQKRDKGRCRICGRLAGPNGKIETRAVFPYLMYFEKYYTPNHVDFITTCERCSKDLIEVRASRSRFKSAGRSVSMCIELTPSGPIERRNVF